MYLWASGSVGKESTCNAGGSGFNPRVGKSPWRREWQPTSVFLPGEPQEQRSLAGYSPWDCPESDTTVQLSFTELYAANSLCTDAQQWKEQTAQQYVTMILRVLKHMHIHTCAHAYEGTALPGYTGPYLRGGGLIFQLLPCCTISVSSVCLC